MYFLVVKLQNRSAELYNCLVMLAKNLLFYVHKFRSFHVSDNVLKRSSCISGTSFFSCSFIRVVYTSLMWSCFLHSFLLCLWSPVQSLCVFHHKSKVYVSVITILRFFIIVEKHTFVSIWCMFSVLDIFNALFIPKMYVFFF